MDENITDGVALMIGVIHSAIERRDWDQVKLVEVALHVVWDLIVERGDEEE